MAYTCVLAPSRECDGCQECENEHKSRADWLWEKQEAEYDGRRDDMYLDYKEGDYDR